MFLNPKQSDIGVSVFVPASGAWPCALRGVIGKIQPEAAEALHFGCGGARLLVPEPCGIENARPRGRRGGRDPRGRALPRHCVKKSQSTQPLV